MLYEESKANGVPFPPGVDHTRNPLDIQNEINAMVTHRRNQFAEHRVKDEQITMAKGILSDLSSALSKTAVMRAEAKSLME